MKSRMRKLIGTFALLILVIVYALAAIDFAPEPISAVPAWLQPVLYLILGMLWIFPAMFVIRWMSRPDKT